MQANDKGEVYIAIDRNVLGTPFLVELKDAPYGGDSEDLAPRSDAVLPPFLSAFAAKVTQVNVNCYVQMPTAILCHHVIVTISQPQQGSFHSNNSFPVEPSP